MKTNVSKKLLVFTIATLFAIADNLIGVSISSRIFGFISMTIWKVLFIISFPIDVIIYGLFMKTILDK